MQGHNPSLIPRILAEELKIERNEKSRKLSVRGSDRRRLDELPTVLFLSDSFILNKQPKTLITIANNNVILVKVILHTFNEPPMGLILDSEKCFCTSRVPAMGLLSSTFQRMTSLFDDAIMTS